MKKKTSSNKKILIREIINKPLNNRVQTEKGTFIFRRTVWLKKHSEWLWWDINVLPLLLSGFPTMTKHPKQATNPSQAPTRWSPPLSKSLLQLCRCLILFSCVYKSFEWEKNIYIIYISLAIHKQADFVWMFTANSKYGNACGNTQIPLHCGQGISKI